MAMVVALGEAHPAVPDPAHLDPALPDLAVPDPVVHPVLAPPVPAERMRRLQLPDTILRPRPTLPAVLPDLALPDPAVPDPVLPAPVVPDPALLDLDHPDQVLPDPAVPVDPTRRLRPKATLPRLLPNTRVANEEERWSDKKSVIGSD